MLWEHQYECTNIFNLIVGRSHAHALFIEGCVSYSLPIFGSINRKQDFACRNVRVVPAPASERWRLVRIQTAARSSSILVRSSSSSGIMQSVTRTVSRPAESGSNAPSVGICTPEGIKDLAFEPQEPHFPLGTSRSVQTTRSMTGTFTASN